MISTTALVAEMHFADHTACSRIDGGNCIAKSSTANFPEINTFADLGVQDIEDALYQQDVA